MYAFTTFAGVTDASRGLNAWAWEICLDENQPNANRDINININNDSHNFNASSSSSHHSHMSHGGAQQRRTSILSLLIDAAGRERAAPGSGA